MKKFTLFAALFAMLIFLPSCDGVNPDIPDKPEEDSELNNNAPWTREFDHVMDGVKFCTDVKVRTDDCPSEVDSEGYTWCTINCNYNCGGEYVYIGMKFEPWNPDHQSQYITNIMFYAVHKDDKDEHDRVFSSGWTKVVDKRTYHIESNKISLNTKAGYRKYDLYVLYTKDNYDGQYVVNHSFEGYSDAITSNPSYPNVQYATDCTRLIATIDNDIEATNPSHLHFGSHDRFADMYDKNGRIGYAETNYGQGSTWMRTCYRIYMVLSIIKPEKWECDLENWMKYVDGDVLISELSMPGSHDSWTNDCVAFNNTACCQQWAPDKQFSLGARVFDMRVNSNYNIVHEIVSTGYAAKPELEKLAKLLKDHPDEFIFLNFQDERVSSSYIKEWTKHTDDMLKEVFSDKAIVYKPGYKLKDVRGKILIFKNTTALDEKHLGGDYLQRVDGRPTPNKGGYPALGWSNIYVAGDDVRKDTFYCQNRFSLSRSEYSAKTETIKDFYRTFDSRSVYKNNIGICYYSAAIADGSSLNATAVTAAHINPEMFDYLSGVSYAGWCHLDFYGSNYARQAVGYVPHQVYGLAVAHKIISKNKFKDK